VNDVRLNPQELRFAESLRLSNPVRGGGSGQSTAKQLFEISGASHRMKVVNRHVWDRIFAFDGGHRSDGNSDLQPSFRRVSPIKVFRGL
jgi:hypothetical protein